MNNNVIQAVAQPHLAQNRLLYGVHRYLTEVALRGSNKRTGCSTEQRNNLYLLADQALAFGVPGDLVAIGHNNASIARVIASVIDHHGAPATFHVYDNTLDGDQPHQRALLDPRACGACSVRLHDGELQDTIPAELPPSIAFAVIDCGQGDPPELHCQRILFCLGAVYPRLSPGAICVLMDHHDPLRTVFGRDGEPGVKMASDIFLRNKPECMQLLFGGQYSQAFFRKVP
jgi:O-methyltransferase